MTTDQLATEFETFQGELKSFLLRMTASMQDAEDIVQDTYLKAHAKIDRFRGESSLKKGRWVLAASIFIGWAAGLATEVSEALIGVFFAFLARGIILNVLKEELPEERQSRFSAFLFGAAAYSILLLLL